MNRQETQDQALHNATTNMSARNYGLIFDGFTDKGIPTEDIKPRVNIFTYNAWRALDRQVRKGEKGVKICTFVLMTKKNQDEPEKKDSFRRPRNVAVFHISQTDEIET